MNANVNAKKKVGYTATIANKKMIEFLNAVNDDQKVAAAEAELPRIKAEARGTLQELHDLYDAAVKNIAAVKTQLLEEKLAGVANKCGPYLKRQVTQMKNGWLENPYCEGTDGRNGWDAKYVNPFHIEKRKNNNYWY